MLSNLIVVTHPGAGGDQLFHTVCTCPLVASVRSADIQYHRLDTLADSWRVAALSRPQARWCADMTLRNTQFCGRQLYPLCRFVFLVREPEEALKRAVAEGAWRAGSAARQYRFRLRRMAEMAAENAGSLLLTHADLASGVGARAVREWMGVKHMTNTYRGEPNVDADPVSRAAVRGARMRYERYLGVMLRHCFVPPGSSLGSSLGGSLADSRTLS